MADKSGFQFVDYLISRSVLFRGTKKSESTYDFELLPAGIINVAEKTFQLTLNLKLNDKAEQMFIEIEAIGFFKYEGDLEKINNFLYLNAPAILFPYLRSYVSSLTALSGLDTITLPTLNLTGMKDEVIENTIIIE